MAWQRPEHQMETVRLTIRVPVKEKQREWVVEAVGASSGSRASLWARRWEWEPSDVQDALQVCDQINWFLHAVLQDRPSSPFWLDRAERGLPCGVQLEFDW